MQTGQWLWQSRPLTRSLVSPLSTRLCRRSDSPPEFRRQLLTPVWLRQPGIPRSARSWRLPVAESLSFRFAVIPRMATQLCSILPGFQLVRQNSDDSLVPPHRQTDKAEVTLTSFSLSWLTAHQSMTVCIPQLHRDALDLADCRPASRAPCAHALARSQ